MIYVTIGTVVLAVIALMRLTASRKFSAGALASQRPGASAFASEVAPAVSNLSAPSAEPLGATPRDAQRGDNLMQAASRDGLDSIRLLNVQGPVDESKLKSVVHAPQNSILRQFTNTEEIHPSTLLEEASANGLRHSPDEFPPKGLGRDGNKPLMRNRKANDAASPIGITSGNNLSVRCMTCKTHMRGPVGGPYSDAVCPHCAKNMRAEIWRMKNSGLTLT